MPARRACVLLLATWVAGCTAASPSASVAPSLTATPTPSALVTSTTTPTATPGQTPTPPAVLLAAGDIASCDEAGDTETAALMTRMLQDDPDATVAILGDSVYPSGSTATYAECFDPVWGSFRDRIRPAIGNHDVMDDQGAAYFDYFGSTAGASGEGWYAYDLGAWRVVVLNSNCELVGCDAGSAQVEWLRGELAASAGDCLLAYWHAPRFSSGPHGASLSVGTFWELLVAADADLVLAGHEHDYERFAPQDAAGQQDPDGPRQIIAGTGGKELRPVGEPVTNSEFVIDDAWGVLRLELAPDGYRWTFVTTDGVEADAGSGGCE